MDMDFGNQRGVGRNFLRMALGVMVFSIDGEGQGSDGVEHRLRQRLRTFDGGGGLSRYSQPAPVAASDSVNCFRRK